MRRKVIQKRTQCLQMRLGNCILFSKKCTGVQNCPLNRNPGETSPVADLNRQVNTTQSDNEFLISDLKVCYLLATDVFRSIFCIFKISRVCYVEYISKKTFADCTSEWNLWRSEEVQQGNWTCLPCQRSFPMLLIRNESNLFYTVSLYFTGHTFSQENKAKILSAVSQSTFLVFHGSPYGFT